MPDPVLVHAPGEFVRSLPADGIAVTGRTIEGNVLTYERPYRVSDDGGATFYREGWRAGALNDGIEHTSNTHEVRIDHRDMRLGLVSLHPHERGVRFRAVADATPEGEAAVAAAEAGLFRGVSLRFISRRQRRSADGVIWRIRATPRELSLVMDGRPQYDDAGIDKVRATNGAREAIAQARQLRAWYDRLQMP